MRHTSSEGRMDVLRLFNVSKSPMLTMPRSNKVYVGALDGCPALLEEGDDAWPSVE